MFKYSFLYFQTFKIFSDFYLVFSDWTKQRFGGKCCQCSATSPGPICARFGNSTSASWHVEIQKQGFLYEDSKAQQMKLIKTWSSLSSWAPWKLSTSRVFQKRWGVRILCPVSCCHTNHQLSIRPIADIPHICHKVHMRDMWRKRCHVDKFQISIHGKCG